MDKKRQTSWSALYDGARHKLALAGASMCRATVAAQGPVSGALVLAGNTARGAGPTYGAFPGEQPAVWPCDLLAFCY